VHIIALTATATKSTRETIFAVLLMDNPCVIFESPNKDNIAYVVEYMSRDEDLEHYFSWLVEELREKKEHCDPNHHLLSDNKTVWIIVCNIESCAWE
jgi:ATP-dependent DNA helicase RecQ